MANPKTAALAILYTLAAAPLWAADPAAVVTHYADLAAVEYADSLTTAQALQTAVAALIAAPSDATLVAAKTAWLAARVPYEQTEVFRFGNPVVDDWQGRVNAAPLEEGLIDYILPGPGHTEDSIAATLNVVATPKFILSGVAIDATTLTPALIAGTLHQADGIEANVASGYHAIEFLLWGQDLSDTGPGTRPFTDYATERACTNANCDRRAAYLLAATDLLVADLAEMVAQWEAGGAGRAAVTADPQQGLLAMLTGMSRLSNGELAGNRLMLGLMLNDPEEEQDDFSDNTPNSHFHAGLGIRNVYLGRYSRLDGTQMTGAALSDLLAATDPALQAQLTAELDATMATLQAIKAAAEGGLAYDRMLQEGNAQGEALITAAVDALVTQTGTIERVKAVLGLPPFVVGGSESPTAPFQ